jgi:uncharacterized membrane protein
MKNEWQSQINASPEDDLKKLAMLVYLLQAVSLFTGSLTLFAGIIINYVRTDDVKGSWIESHFRWQKRTFWYSLIWTLIGGVTVIFLVGWVILLGVTIWMLYRVVKGWVSLSENRPMPS